MPETTHIGSLRASLNAAFPAMPETIRLLSAGRPGDRTSDRARHYIPWACFLTPPNATVNYLPPVPLTGRRPIITQRPGGQGPPRSPHMRLCYPGSMLSVLPWQADQAAAWDEFVAGHPSGHFLQAWGWGRLRERWGWRALRLAATDEDGQLVAALQLLVRRSPAGSLAYGPRGPVCWPADPSWSALRAAVRSAVPRLVVMRLEPNWPDEASTRSWLSQQGLCPAAALQPPSTLRIDLRASDEELLAAMKQKWRYNIRLAQRHGVAVRQGAAGDLDAFYSLLSETSRRDGFAIRPRDYYRAVWDELSGCARLYLAEREGALLAAILVVHFGLTATYLYGASTSVGREHMPNHLLQWQAMRWAREEGLTTYDLWGIPDAIGRAVVAGRPADELSPGRGGLWGVWGFKRGFGGIPWRSVGAWDDVVAPIPYRLGQWLTRLRQRGHQDQA